MDLVIATEYSAYPSGRDEADGPYNGERFREQLLYPRIQEALRTSARLTVHLGGVMSFGSSFLEEAFGGLIRKKHVSKQDLGRVLEIDPGRAGNERYKQAILRYIEEARKV